MLLCKNPSGAKKPACKAAGLLWFGAVQMASASAKVTNAFENLASAWANLASASASQQTKGQALSLKLLLSCSCEETPLGQRNLLAKQLACFGLELRRSFFHAERLACFCLKLLENCPCAETHLGQRNLLAKGWPAFV
jgi:hypothetical protein